MNLLKKLITSVMAMMILAVSVVPTAFAGGGPIYLDADSVDNTIYLDWAPWYGQGDVFDKYHVAFKKGYYADLNEDDAANAYITWDYYNLTGLEIGDWWTFKVVPVKESDEGYEQIGGWSNVVQVVVQGDEIAAPSIIYPKPNEVVTPYPREIYLEWTPVNDADPLYEVSAYQIEMACDICAPSEAKWVDSVYYNSSTHYFTTPPLAGDNQFRFRVRGIDMLGNNGPWSDYRYFTSDTSGYADTPEPIDLAIVSWSDSGLPKIKWSQYEGNFDGYAMFVKEGFYSGEAIAMEVNPSYFGKNVTSHQLVKMKTNTNYTVQIIAYNNNVNGGYTFPKAGQSNMIYFTTGYGEPPMINPIDEIPPFYGIDVPPAGFEGEVYSNPYYGENPFSDTSMKTLEGQAAAYLYNKGVIGGYPDGEFKGWKAVNRAELAKFLLLARYGEVANVANNGQFPDVKDGEWYVRFIVTAANLGIMDGDGAGYARPGDTVNTAEFLKMLTMTFDLDLNLDYDYWDVNSGDWYAPFAGVAQQYELFPNRTIYLNPSSSLTRNEVAVAIYKILTYGM